MPKIGEIKSGRECIKCKVVKPTSEFYWRKDNNTYRNDCKLCLVLSRKQWHKDNPDYSRISASKWRKTNPIKSNAICKKYRDTNKAKRFIVCTNWRVNNPDKSNAIQKRSYTKRRRTPSGNLNHRMEVAIRSSLKGNKNNRSWEGLIGFTVKELRIHLEKLFTDSMNWEKFLNGEIHIDHIVPKSAFHYNSPDDIDFKRCWALSNLQPLWHWENESKSGKILKPFQPSLKIK